MFYIRNNGKGWYIESTEGKEREDGSLRHYAWSGIDWSTIVAKYWDKKEDAEKVLKNLIQMKLAP